MEGLLPLKPRLPSLPVQPHFTEIPEIEEPDMDHRPVTGKVPTGDTQPGFLHQQVPGNKEAVGRAGEGGNYSYKHVSQWLLIQTNIL